MPNPSFGHSHYTTGLASKFLGVGGLGLEYGDKHTKDLGWLGKNSLGENNTVSSWQSATSDNIQDGVQNLIGGERGSVRAAFGDEAAFEASRVTDAATLGVGSTIAAASAASGLWDWLTD